LGMGSLTLSDLLRSRAEAASAGVSTSNKSVVWLWLGGGPTHVETFDPKMTAPAEYRSVTGEGSRQDGVRPIVCPHQQRALGRDALCDDRL
jgi:hypothetical protein